MLNSMVCPIAFGCGLGYAFGIYGLFAGIALSPAMSFNRNEFQVDY
jgi:hypothetical protein